MKFGSIQASRLAAALGVFLAALVLLSALGAIALLRRQAIDDWQRQSAAFSTILAESTAQQMSAAYLALDSIAERIEDYSSVDAAYLSYRLRTPEFFQLLREKKALSPQIDAIGVLDADGNIINYSREFPAPKRNLADRDYFIAQRDNPALGVFVSAPIHNRADGRWTFYISRRLTGSDGEFIGLVQLGISPAFYSGFYERVSLQGKASITLLRDDYTVLARWPTQDSLMGRRILHGSTYHVVHDMGKKDGVVLMDNERQADHNKPVGRMGAVRVVENYPLIVNFTIGEDVYLADWRRSGVLIAMAAAASIAAILVAFILLARMLRRREDNLKVTTELKQQAEEVSRSQALLLRNLTEQQRVLKDTSDRMEAIFQNAADGIIMIDGEGNIEAFNRAAELIYGYRNREVVGRHSRLLSVQGQQDMLALAAGRSEFVHTGQVHLEDEPLRSDGRSFPAELSISEYRVSGQRKLIVIVRDVTERRQMERIKSEFISTVSHELRTPLTAIRGALGLMLGGVVGDVPGGVQPLISIAYKNSESLTRLINDLLDIQKVEAGKMDFKYELVPVQVLLENAIHSNQAFAHSLGVSIVQEGTPIDAVLKVDIGRFQQVMANLLSNACKYSPAGTEVRVNALRTAEDKVRVEVIDRGSGVPEEFRERIFQKFSQADSSDTRAKGGTGLGLAITRAIVTQMGGDVGFYTLDDGQGQETHFYVELSSCALQELHEA